MGRNQWREDAVHRASAGLWRIQHFCLLPHGVYCDTRVIRMGFKARGGKPGVVSASVTLALLSAITVEEHD